MNDRILRVLEFDKILELLKNYASSDLAKDLINNLRPSKVLEDVVLTQDETSDAVDFVMKLGNAPTSGIFDIKISLMRADKGGILNPSELLKIASVLRCARQMKLYANNDKRPIQIGRPDNLVFGLISILHTNKNLEERISNAIISDEEISDDASPALRNIRRQILLAQSTIRERLNDIIKSQKYQKFIQEAVVTMRGDRYVIPVKQEYKNDIQGLIHDSSTSGATVFIEPMAVVEQNNNIKKLRIKETQEIERILAEFTLEVDTQKDELASTLSVLVNLDFIFAKAKFGINYKGSRPKLNNQKRIIIKRGRHPLIDVKKVVPIDFYIGEDYNTLIVTGPNTGGKTVTMKTVGLLSLMAQAGLLIPADDGTELNVFEHIFADIGDEQSIEQSLSTFSSHMGNIVKILGEINSNSLVLLDELGAGTDPAEGAALAMSILEQLNNQGVITISSTHYTELKIFALSTKGLKNACCEFDVETLKPTYKLLIGIPGKSNAFAISQKLGLNTWIIERAREFLTRDEIKFEDVLLSIEKNLSQTEKDRTIAKQQTIEIGILKRELELQIEKIENQKNEVIRKANLEAKKVIENAKASSDLYVERAKELEAQQKYKELLKFSEESKKDFHKDLNEHIENSIERAQINKFIDRTVKDIRIGDHVLLVALNQKGIVVTAPDNKGIVAVQAGSIKINVSINNLKVIEHEKSKQTNKISHALNVDKTKTVSTEIDVRGLNVLEATDIIDKYIDNASLVTLHMVTIIHGKGTGQLRKGVHDFLRRHPHVKTFRVGLFGEGDNGVTIVEIK